MKANSLNELVKIVMGKTAGVIFDISYFSELIIALIAITLAVSELCYRSVEPKVWKWLSFLHVSEANQNFETFNRYFVYIFGFIIFFLNV